MTVPRQTDITCRDGFDYRVGSFVLDLYGMPLATLFSASSSTLLVSCSVLPLSFGMTYRGCSSNTYNSKVCKVYAESSPSLAH